MKDATIDAFAQKAKIMDIESILTRAIYQVLNENSQNATEKVRKVGFSSDMSNQMRLLAEQLCKKVEKKYEKRLQDQREQDRHKTERQLGSLRREYQEELEMKKSQLERERHLLVESYEDKLRASQQKLDIRLIDKENGLDIQKKLLDNRYAELKLVREQLEKASESFKRKMEIDLDALRIEREKLSSERVDLSSTSKQKFDMECSVLKKRISELEQENVVLQSTLSQKETEIFVLKEKIRAQTEISIFQKVPNTFSDMEVKLLKEENTRLKEQMATYEKGLETKIEMQKYYLNSAHEAKIKEQNMIIDLLNSKVRNLKTEVKRLQEMPNVSRKNYFRRKATESTDNRDSPESCSESSYSMTPKNTEIEKIKKRLKNLDDISKELDVSVERYSSIRRHITRSFHEHDEVGTDLDDYCRSHNSPIKQIEAINTTIVTHDIPTVSKYQSPKKEKGREENHYDMPPPQEKPPSHMAKEVKDSNEFFESPQNVPRQESPKVEDDSMFEGVDPAMREYMKLVMQKRSTPANPEPSKLPERVLERVNSVEITRAEEVQFDNAYVSDGEIEW